MKDNGANLATRLRQVSKELLAAADAIDAPKSIPELSIPEKVRRITDKLGTGETARRLRVDPSTVISWRNGNGILQSNLLKLLPLYDELSGNGG